MAHPVIDADECIACGVCVDSCPAGVLELQDASGAGVDANATSDALVGINYGMSHGSFLSVDRRYRRCASV